MPEEDVSAGAQLSKVCTHYRLPISFLGRCKSSGVLPAEEDVMTRLNNTMTMQTSTSYQQIPSFHSEVCLEDTKMVCRTGEQKVIVTPVLQRPEQDTLKAKVRQLARLQHLSVRALTASPKLRVSSLVVCLFCTPAQQGLHICLVFAPAQIASATVHLSHTVWSHLPNCTVLLLQICSHNILGQMQLDDVWFCLLRHATRGADTPDDSRLHYDDFCQAQTQSHICNYIRFHMC